MDHPKTRAEGVLSPGNWPVWPRAGPSTLVWIFEGNFFLRDHPQTRAEGVLSPGNWPVWPRAGPSTLVWTFEGKIFFLRDILRLGLRVCSPQEIGQSGPGLGHPPLSGLLRPRFF